MVDGTSKEVSEKQDPWSSWALVVFLGITLTLVIIAIAIGKLHSIKKWDHFPIQNNIYWLVLGLIAKLNTASASQQRRQRAAAAAAAASANRHSAQMAASKTYNNGANDSSLLNAAFQTTSDQSPDVIPHFNGGKKIVIIWYIYKMLIFSYSRLDGHGIYFRSIFFHDQAIVVL